MRKYFQEELKELQINDDSIVEERWEKLKEIIYKGKKNYIPTIKIKTTKKEPIIPDNVKKDIRNISYGSDIEKPMIKLKNYISK